MLKGWETYQMQITLADISDSLTEKLKGIELPNSYTLLKLLHNAIRSRYKDSFTEKSSDPNCIYLGKVEENKYFKCKWLIGEVNGIYVVSEFEVVRTKNDTLIFNAIMLYPANDESILYEK